MKSWRILLLFSWLFLQVGCAIQSNYNIQPVDTNTAPIDIVEGIPLNAVLLISNQMENYQQTVEDPHDLLGTKYTFPMGQIIKKYAPKILSSVFNKVEVVKGKPYPADAEVVIVPKVEHFSLRMPPAGFSKEAVAKISLGITVYDVKGQFIWEYTATSPEVKGGRTFIRTSDMLEVTGAAAAKAVAIALQQTVKAMDSSRKTMLASVSKGELEGKIVSTPNEEQVQNDVVVSDVDVPPTMMAKLNKNAYAIVIGIEEYRQKLPKAEFAVQDAKIIARYLNRTMGYPEENIITLINDRALKSDFAKYFERWLSNNVEPGGTVFVYYSGHGAPNPKTGDAYLVPYDGDPSFIAETGYPLKRMYDVLSKLPAKEIIVVLDSCFSGAGGRSVLAKGSRPLVMNLQTGTIIPRNMTVVTASSGSQVSSTYDKKGHGLFTYFLLKGIKSENVFNSDGSIQMETLFSYIKPRVESIARKLYNNEQTPQLMGALKIEK